MSEPIAFERLGMCDCARTREYCVTRGCKRDSFEWRYSTEGRDRDHLRRIVDLRRRQAPVSRWIRPERAAAEAWLMNMKAAPAGSVFIEKLGRFGVDMAGVPGEGRMPVARSPRSVSSVVVAPDLRDEEKEKR